MTLTHDEASVAPAWVRKMLHELSKNIPEAEIVPWTVCTTVLEAYSGALSEAQWETVRRGFLVACIDVALEAARSMQLENRWSPEVAAACAQCRAAVLSGEREGYEQARLAATLATNLTRGLPGAGWAVAKTALSAVSPFSADESPFCTAKWAAVASWARKIEMTFPGAPMPEEYKMKVLFTFLREMLEIIEAQINGVET